MTKLCLSRQIFFPQPLCRDELFWSRQTFCRDKHTVAPTKDVFCRDKTHVCPDKNTSVAAPANDSKLWVEFDVSHQRRCTVRMNSVVTRTVHCQLNSTFVISDAVWWGWGLRRCMVQNSIRTHLLYAPKTRRPRSSGDWAPGWTCPPVETRWPGPPANHRRSTTPTCRQISSCWG